MNLFLLFWITLCGLAIGSFLNVVIYRLPQRQSLSFPPSHCPNCQHPIRWFDNMPVLSWFILRGKCRDCQEPISRRYPIIEAICGFVFFLFGFHALFCAAEPLEQAMILTAQNLILFCTLFAAGMIEFDRKTVPTVLFLPALLIGFPLFFVTSSLINLSLSMFVSVDMVLGTFFCLKREYRCDWFWGMILLGLFTPLLLFFFVVVMTLIGLGIARLCKKDIPPILLLCIWTVVGQIGILPVEHIAQQFDRLRIWLLLSV
ncbi:MAG: prepilin peptidase [Thermoguttaceae bacterium]